MKFVEFRMKWRTFDVSIKEQDTCRERETFRGGILALSEEGRH